jgi:hypothetical protein
MKHGRRHGVGGEKRLDGEFRGGDVERRAEGGHGAEKGEFLAFVAYTKRHDDVAGAGDLDRGFGLVGGVGAELVQETRKPGIGGQGDLAAEASEQMGLPLAQVHDPRRHAIWVQAYPQYIDRGRE